MNDTRFSIGRKAVIYAVLLLVALFLAGCGGAESPAAPTAAPTQQAVAAATATQPPPAPTDTAVPSPEPSPTSPPTEPPPTDTPTPEPTAVADNSACVACHTSEQTLQALAKPEEEKEELSEGEG